MQNGQTEVVRLLLDSDANVNAATPVYPMPHARSNIASRVHVYMPLLQKSSTKRVRGHMPSLRET